MYRAKLVLLRPIDDEESADIDDGDGTHYERVGVLEPPRAPGRPPPHPGRAAGLSGARGPAAAARACCCVLTGLTLSTAVLGVLPALRLAWILTALYRRPAARPGRAHRLRPRDRGAARERRRRPAPLAGASRRIARSTSRPSGAGRRGCPVPGTPRRTSPARLPPAADRRHGAHLGGRLSSPDAGGVAQLVERYVRNVEAEGSSPFTSTKGPGQRPKVGSPKRSDSPTCLYVSLSGSPRRTGGATKGTPPPEGNVLDCARTSERAHRGRLDRYASVPLTVRQEQVPAVRNAF